MFDMTLTESVISALTTGIGSVVIVLMKRINKHEARCLANEKQCREDALRCHEKIETLLKNLLTNTLDSNKRQESLMVDLKHSYDHTSKAISGFSSSGEHPAITARKRKQK